MLSASLNKTLPSLTLIVLRFVTNFSRIKNRSILSATAKFLKDATKNERNLCKFYNRFGRCRRGKACPYTHDPDRIAVCTRFVVALHQQLLFTKYPCVFTFTDLCNNNNAQILRNLALCCWINTENTMLLYPSSVIIQSRENISVMLYTIYCRLQIIGGIPCIIKIELDFPSLVLVSA